MKHKQIAELLQYLRDKLAQAQKKRNFSKMGMNDKIAALKEELMGQKVAERFWVEDLYDDYIVIRTYPGWMDEDQEEHLLRVPYIIEDEVVTFGSPQEVERVTTYEAIANAEPEEMNGGAKAQSVEYKELLNSSPFPIPLRESAVILQFDKESLEQAKQSKDESSSLRFSDAVATVFEIENAHGQYYPKSVWEKNIAQMNNRALENSLVGEANHPDSRPAIERQCVKFEKVWIPQGKNEVHAQGVIMPTSIGKDLIAQAKEGIPLALSSRGYGTVKPQSVNGKKLMVVQDDFYCETFDLVWKPAAEGSYITKYEAKQEVKTPVILSQSKKEGDKKQMNEIEKLILKLQGQLDLLKEQGVEVAELAQELERIEQMSKEGVSEATVKSFLAPFGEKVAKAISKPGDPDKGAGVFDPARTQAAPAAPENSAVAKNSLQQSMEKELKVLQEANKKNAINTILQGVEAKYQEFYRQELEACEDVEAVNEAKAKVDAKLQGIFKSFNIQPGIGLTEKEARYQNAPKTPTEAIEKLLEGVEDTKNPDTGEVAQDFSNPRWCLRKILQNMANVNQSGMRRYLEIQQGLFQAGEFTTADLTTGNAFLFPIVRRAFPRIIAHEIASIQPMSSDSGKIFYLDTKNEDGALLDENHYYTYADGGTELTGTAKKIKIALSSENISVASKKLQTEVSYEVIQDLLANFGLDAQDETMAAAASEIAHEWNNQILVDFAFASGTTGNVTFGKTAPSGFTQTEWDQNQLLMHIQKVNTNVFNARYDNITHILCGGTTGLQFAKLGARGGFLYAKGDEKKTIYTGMNLFGTVNGTWAVWTAPILEQVIPGKAILLRKGERWSDTAYVYAPYVSAVTPGVHDPNSFKINQGIMDRAARKVVVPKNIGYLTFSDTTGTAI
jgi:hypothetical protein